MIVISVFNIKAGLHSHGHSVEVFNDARQALAKYTSGRYDAAVLDFKMPTMSGFELARALWQKDKNLQVCFLSAFEVSETEAKTVLPSLKSHCFLTKPISICILSNISSRTF